MTPAEKAKELYLKYYGIPLYVKTVKKCCHIAVDEIIYTVGGLEDSVFGFNTIDFWKEVKQEIDKI